jgi:hypothetical protein
MARTVFHQKRVPRNRLALRLLGTNFQRRVSVLVFMHSSIWSNPYRVDSYLSGCAEWVGNRILTFAPDYLIGREPVMRMSTSLLALCCQSGPDAT